MGIIPHGESPWGRAPTIRFGMAADAINVSETTYMTAVRYYLANLGTTMESQVRSSVRPPIFCLVCLSVTIYSLAPPLLPLRLAVCRALSLILLAILRKGQLELVAARQSRT